MEDNDTGKEDLQDVARLQDMDGMKTTNEFLWWRGQEVDMEGYKPDQDQGII